MSHIAFTSVTMPGAGLGPVNPLAALRTLDPAPRNSSGDNRLPDGTPVGYGLDNPLLPYRYQDGYTREKRPREFPVAAIENDFVRAEVLLGLGGRVRSIIHKPSGRELLERNPVFQPANLAARNAWFSGGIEWNIGMRGHSPHTCSPLFAGVIRRDDGTPALRLWEYERVRGAPYRVELFLPEGSHWLMAYVVIDNPHPHEIPMYWWTNMAVPETDDMRVIAPAERAIRYSYRGGIDLVPVPRLEGRDVSRPRTIPGSRDYFYRVPDGARPWIAALYGTGSGFAQTSTMRQRGRKLFVWGRGRGGRHWQEYLAEPGRAYVEIQAGLAPTQYACIPMPAGARWDWVEAFGPIEADADIAHGDDWRAARAEVAGRLDAGLPAERLDEELDAMRTIADRPPEEIVQYGSGWGALEQRRRSAMALPALPDAGVPFGDESLTDAQSPWIELLEDDRLHEPDPRDEPGETVDAAWRPLLERAVEQGGADHWYGLYHLGLLRHAAGDGAGACQAWRRSIAMKPSAWALRNLGLVAYLDKRFDEASRLYERALDALAEPLRPLVIEAFEAFLKAGRADEVRCRIVAMDDRLRHDGRIRIFEAEAAIELADYDMAQAILSEPIDVPDIRECEKRTTDLWFELKARRLAEAEGVEPTDALRKRVREEYDPPRHLDFRMG